MNTLWQDLRFSIRMLVKKPSFTLITVTTLALGIGLNTAIFSVVDAVLLSPLPFKNPERLMTVWTSDARRPSAHGNISYPNFVDLRQQSRSFKSLAAFRTTNVALTDRDEAIRLRAAVVTTDLLTMLGVEPLIGRDFLPEDEQPGKSVVILSNALWRSRFKSEPQVVGQNVTLDNRSLTVVGVMPPGFQFPIEAELVELWTTVPFDGPMISQRGLQYLNVIGLIEPGITIAQAQSELDVIAQGLEQQYPDNNANQGMRLTPALEELVGDVWTPLLVIFGAVVCVLLIACANVANLLLARATARQHEMAVRFALGAKRGRVIRQLLTESILLSFIGGVCGLLLALWGTDLLVSLSPETIPRANDIRIDVRVLGFTLLVTLLTGILFGLAPALHAAGKELTETLKEGGRGTSDGVGRSRTRGALVIAELAVALVLMIGSGLLLKSFLRLLRVHTGVDPDKVLTLRVNLPDNKYSDPQAVSFYEQLQARLQSLPGVRAASASFTIPFGRGRIGTDLYVEGQVASPGQVPHVDCHVILPDYFRVMGVPLIAGRDFTARDDMKNRPVVIVNEALVRRFFPNEDPLGKRIRPDMSATPGDSEMREIVGVVGDVMYYNLTAEVEPEAYLSYSQMPITTGLTVVLTSEGDPRNLIGVTRGEIQALDRELPVFDVKTLNQYFSMAVAHPRFNSLLVGIFACLALILTAIGLYGVMSYSVAQRTHEIGIRSALGASRRDILKLVLGQGLRFIVIGVSLGLGVALALTRLMGELLFGVAPTDVATFAAVVLVLLAVALFACFVPARRATKVEPIVALRYE